jgi:hypothetical protein
MTLDQVNILSQVLDLRQNILEDWCAGLQEVHFENFNKKK